MSSTQQVSPPVARKSGGSDGGAGAVGRRLINSNVAPIAVALVVVCVILSVLTPTFLTSGNLSNIVTQSAVVGIAAIGATFVIITSGIDLSVGSNIAFAGLVGAISAQATDNGFVGILVAVLAAVAVGAFNGFAVSWAWPADSLSRSVRVSRSTGSRPA
jgi:ribose/xylose/arabinose/galactoside ABC-type transport system permease subunit